MVKNHMQNIFLEINRVFIKQTGRRCVISPPGGDDQSERLRVAYWYESPGSVRHDQRVVLPAEDSVPSRSSEHTGARPVSVEEERPKPRSTE